MTYILLVFSGVVMGLVAAVPIGPVNLICIRRTFAFGPVNGFVSGLGAALGDGLFAAITAFGLTWVSQMIEGYSAILELVGGAMLVWFGYRIYGAPAIVARLDDGEGGDKGGSNLVRAIVSTFALTVTNPVTLFSFTFMMAGLGGLAGGAGSYVSAGFVVAGVVAGSTAWWLVLTTVIGIFHTKIDERWMRNINRITGLLVMLCGLAVLFHVVRKLA
jgi:threonine/homoserine/homoserine lactone efflux protein